MEGAATTGNQELRDSMVKGRPYILMVGGREHNVCLERIGLDHLFGCVAINKTLLLIDRKGAGLAVAKVVLPQDEKAAIGPGDELFYSAPVVVEAPHLRIRIRTSSIDIVEDPWRPFLDAETVSPDGKVIDDGRLLKAIPSLAGYHVDGQGFVKNPDVWAVPPASKTVDLHLTEDPAGG